MIFFLKKIIFDYNIPFFEEKTVKKKILCFNFARCLFVVIIHSQTIKGFVLQVLITCHLLTLNPSWNAHH
jgi:hypothetical protein